MAVRSRQSSWNDGSTSRGSVGGRHARQQCPQHTSSSAEPTPRSPVFLPCTSLGAATDTNSRPRGTLDLVSPPPAAQASASTFCAHSVHENAGCSSHNRSLHCARDAQLEGENAALSLSPSECEPAQCVCTSAQSSRSYSKSADPMPAETVPKAPQNKDSQLIALSPDLPARLATAAGTGTDVPRCEAVSYNAQTTEAHVLGSQQGVSAQNSSHTIDPSIDGIAAAVLRDGEGARVVRFVSAGSCGCPSGPHEAPHAVQLEDAKLTDTQPQQCAQQAVRIRSSLHATQQQT